MSHNIVDIENTINSNKNYEIDRMESRKQNAFHFLI